ncbi:hypothetical protein B9Z55_028383 [Caenorhabditis nigoni]|nr:hypothetical protein B9Z55_028383 [Caenorhabditis nigoni]
MRRPSSNATFASDFLRKPVQITADPRVYKGSVFANRRLAHDRVSMKQLKSSNRFLFRLDKQNKLNQKRKDIELE